MGWIDNFFGFLSEGFKSDSAASKVRDGLQTDKERAAEEVRRSHGTNFGGARAWSVLGSSGYQGLADHLVIESDLMARYLDYEEMDDFPELHTALDIYADDATAEDSLRNKSIWVTSENQKVRDFCNELLHKTLRVEEDLWGIARTTGKFGNHFAEILLAEGKGVVGLSYMSPETVRRVEDYGGTLLGFVQTFGQGGVSIEDFKSLFDNKGRLVRREAHADSGMDPRHTRGPGSLAHAIPFESWEVVHWRLRGRWMRSMYGHSILEPARWIWRRLVLLEDAALLYKLTRAPARYAYYIDTGDLAPNQALAYVNNVKRQHRKKKYVNSRGQLEFKVNPLSQDEDFWIPTRGGKESTRIDILSGADWQSMEDLRFFRQKLLASIKIPATYIGMSEQGDDARASLSTQDVRFAKSILRLQRAIKNGFRKVIRVHLIANGIDPNAVEWDIHMAVPSSIFELAQIEVRNAQADLASRMEPFASKEWIMSNIFNFSKDEADAMRAAQKDDAEEDALHNAQVQKKAAEIMGVEPDATDMPDAPGTPPAAQTGATSQEKGTGDKSPSPTKGKPKDESAVDRLASLRARYRIKAKPSAPLNERRNYVKRG